MFLYKISFAILVFSDAFGQTGPVVNRAGYDLPTPVKVAPGQLLTFFVTGVRAAVNRVPSGSDFETNLAGVSIKMVQRVVDFAYYDLPIQEVRPTPTCLNIAGGSHCLPPTLAVTIQVPYELQHRFDVCPACFGPGDPQFAVLLDGEGMYAIDGAPFPDQVRILRAFDSVLASRDPDSLSQRQCARGNNSGNVAPANTTGLACPAIVKHADGSLVSPTNPAKAGEELVAYAIGLGQTSPESETGKIVKASSPTVTQYAMDFNYRRNALGTRPPPTDTPGVPTPLYTGTLEGSVGIYEVRFIVPPVPAGTPPCDSLESPQGGLPRDNIVYSNLTFSIGGRSSFDGAGICVAVESEKEEE